MKKLFSNKIIVYLSSGYFSYFVQFIISLVIASKLGPYYFGIYGFITLILNYCSVLSFGIPSSLNVLVVHNKNDLKSCGNYICNSLWLYGILSFLLLIATLFIWFSKIEISINYPIREYLPIVLLIAIANYINSIYNTILRIRGKVNQLSLIQVLGVIFNIIAILSVKGKVLIIALLICLLLNGIATIIITYKSDVLPKVKDVSINLTIQLEILKKGILLFLYNSCFSFILISIRSLVSSNYQVEEFGAFTFSFSVANSVILLLESLMAILFPKILDLLSSDDNTVIESTLDKLRGTYISSSHFLIYLAMIFYPLLILFMPKYSNALTSMNLIALAVLMNTNSCGYSALLIAKNKEKTSAYLSMIALVVNVFLGIIMIYVFHVQFSYVILATLITYLIFSFLVVREGKKTLGVNNIKSIIYDFFPIRFLIPYSAALIISCFQYESIIWMPLVLYIIFNTNDIKMIYKMAYKMINNPNIIDLK